MPDWIIWGARGHAAVLVDLLREQHQASVLACFDNDPLAPAKVLGVPRVGGNEQFQSWLGAHDPRSIHGAVAIGGSRGRERRSVACQLRSSGVDTPTLAHPTANVSPSASIEQATQVLALAHIGSRAMVGECCIINSASVVEHDVILEDGVHVAPGAVLCGEVHVARDAMLGAGCIVLPRLRIGEGAVVGAGAVVVKDVPARATVVGNPARVVQIGDQT